jgi:hypothetical protein
MDLLCLTKLVLYLGFCGLFFYVEATSMISDAIQVPGAPGIHGLRFQAGENRDNI